MRAAIVRVAAFTCATVTAHAVGAFESERIGTDPITGDPVFGSEHVALTSMAFAEAAAFDHLGPACTEVLDFNGADHRAVLPVRKVCPAVLAELPDFSWSMEDYIDQNRHCPPLSTWSPESCHTFEHFMGGLNATHFPPQTERIYRHYHRIAVAVRDLGDALHGALFDHLAHYQSYVDECRYEALTYEAIGQHYLQDRWAMGHMWYRWGGPEVTDFAGAGNPLAAVLDLIGADDALPSGLREMSYGQLVGAISGLIHGWKHTVDGLFGITQLSDDAMSFPAPGVHWIQGKAHGARARGVGDLFLALGQREGDFAVQLDALRSCMLESVRQVAPFGPRPDPDMPIDPTCFEPLATNEAVWTGWGLSPSFAASLALTIGLHGVDAVAVDHPRVARELSDLTARLWWAARLHPDDTFIAEGYTGPERGRRLTLFGMQPNDVYDRLPTHVDPARDAPGDPAAGDLPDEPLFGARQVRFFNKCHAQHFCADPDIVRGWRARCDPEALSGLAACEVCEELAGRFFLGAPPLCSLLAPSVSPLEEGVGPPTTADAVAAWCRREPFTAGTCAELPRGASCDDGDACTEDDRCDGATCAGDARDCDDGIACTVDGCDQASGACTHRESGCPPDPCLGKTCEGVATLDAGGAHTCVVLTDGTVRCWGAAWNGRLGNGDDGDHIMDGTKPQSTAAQPDEVPTRVPIPGATHLALGGAHSCAIDADRYVVCWGHGGSGQLGTGATEDVMDEPGELPARVRGEPGGDGGDGGDGGGDADAAGGGDDTTGGEVEDDGDTGSSPGPSGLLRATAIAAGGEHTCALTTADEVRCWGAGASGRLGNGSTDALMDERGEAPSVVPLSGPATAIALGARHSCAIVLGDVACWGDGSSGQLGSGDRDHRMDEPGQLPATLDFGGQVRAIAAGNAHTCAIVGSQVRCWGDGRFGQLGHGARDALMDEAGELASSPDVGQASAIAAGGNFTCAIAGGAVRCWGQGGSGVMGNGSNDDLMDEPGEEPSRVDLGGETPLAIAAGQGHLCAVLAAGKVKCWGGGDYGALGYHTWLDFGGATGYADIGSSAPPMPPPFVNVRGLDRCFVEHDASQGWIPSAISCGHDADWCFAGCP